MIQSRHCIYHATLPARVVNRPEYMDLLNSGEWFDSPYIIPKEEETKNEEIIERQSGERILLSEDRGNLRGSDLGSQENRGIDNENGNRTQSEDLGERESSIKRRGRPKKV